MLNNYDKIAKSYDALSRLVYFKAQVNAQINQLHIIPENAHILIVGGGTGWILEEIAKIRPSGLKITYIEISDQMIQLSKKRKSGLNLVSFLSIGIEDFQATEKFDVILTPFLFDNFNKKRVETVFNHLNALLEPTGLWFHVDFCLDKRYGKWWKLLLLKSMYKFFKWMGNVEATELIDLVPYFLTNKYSLIKKQYYYGHFIKASIYQK
ncbi:class I SAM-dependent methyltransferase [Pedobacter sp. AW1-32]|uniref:class I SAM-dependent methyltransferase n=1 Tax=Pedobacter sp. AW1-32 TaxID=3383026 RepID=UPI003FEEE7AB